MDNVVNAVDNVNGQQAQPVAQPVAQVAQQPVAQPQVVQPVAQPVVQPNTQAMFTQEQLNSIISGRINPLNQKIQELNGQLANEQKLSASYLNELNGYKHRESATKAGVPAQFVDFAVFEANKLAVNGKSFDDAIKEYVSANATLFGVSQQGEQAPASTAPSGQQATGVSVAPTQPAQPLQNNQAPNAAAVIAFGATGVQGGGNPSGNANLDSDVEAFLKSRGLKK